LHECERISDSARTCSVSKVTCALDDDDDDDVISLSKHMYCTVVDNRSEDVSECERTA